MSQENTVGAQKPASIKPMQVLVRGRIEQMRSFDGTRYTRIMTPAPDAYSRPQVVEVRGKQRLGEKGDEVTVLCSLGGYQRKPYQIKNKDTGEIETIVPVDHVLDVVEQ
ncbi:single-stranded DNA-binding protein [Ralstonia mannitolilytica]|uniref:single-stranded DNA-binding protein n=1 Tax=Ralstonia mannitolilytica TaxID=105219 RepID=UPI0026ED85D0|nr:single-stranded DNA-binding protein [Ralstonia mannitolilytica]